MIPVYQISWSTMQITTLILFFYLPSSVIAPFANVEVATIPARDLEGGQGGNTSSLVPSVSQVVAYNHGDVIGEYKLEQRLDYLGTEWFHHDFSQMNLLIGPGGHTAGHGTTGETAVNGVTGVTGIAPFEREQATSFGYLTLLNEIRMDVNASCIRNGTFCLDQHIFRGGHGEVWRARQISLSGIVDQNSSFILKRMHIKNRPDILRCALREIHFGTILSGVSNVARFVSHFKTDDDYW